MAPYPVPATALAGGLAGGRRRRPAAPCRGVPRPACSVAARCRDRDRRRIAAAGTAPSGANQQPWHFVAVSDPEVKRRIRSAAEAEEREFYERRAPEEWLEALRPIGTDWRKPFLETAPWLIAIFVQKWSRAAGRQQGEALLPGGVGGHRHRHPDHGAAYSGARDPHAHPEPDGIPERDPRPACRCRAAVPAAGGGSPGRRGPGAGHRAPAARRDFILGLRADGSRRPGTHRPGVPSRFEKYFLFSDLRCPGEAAPGPVNY
ncbi:MAG: nitroreductase family protein [Desulfobacterales bacterium]|nr:nitroreductase family protein [Desulfobacterales bacterium]